MTAPVELLVGDRIVDNDPRVGYRRVLHIVGIADGYAEVEERVVKYSKRFRVLCRRIHTDGKPRRSGFSLVPRDEVSA